MIQFTARSFQGTRSYGLYAVAACISCVLKRDLAGLVFDEDYLQQHLLDVVEYRKVRHFTTVCSVVCTCSTATRQDSYPYKYSYRYIPKKFE